MKKWLAVCAASASAAAAVPPLPGPEARVAQIARAVEPARLRTSVERLIGFGTRHTLSSQSDDRRGIGAAVRWAEGELKKNGLETFQACETLSGRRVPRPTRVCNAVGLQRGRARPNDVVIISGHIDSRVSDVMNFTANAPGANDDGSGTAAVLEAARVLSGHRFDGTIVYAALSGEEQGLLGAGILARHAKAQGWNVIAHFSNDIIGNSCGSDGTCNDRQVRIFSEGPRWQGHEALAEQVRSLGGENDAPSRNLSRFLDTLSERLAADLGIDVKQIWRNDRFGRGGDHIEFLNAGFPAVRFTVAVENYNHQHQDLRVENGVDFGDTIDKMDFNYLARVTKLNVAALAWLASAPPPPEPTVEGAVSPDTRVRWRPMKGPSAFRIYKRPTEASNWDVADALVVANCADAPDCPGGASEHTLRSVRVDDWIFGVSSVSSDGFESPVASAVPGGAFRPWSPQGTAN